MTERVVSPYRESEGPALVERACPKCGAHVSYEADATSAMCQACDTRFAVGVQKLSVGDPAIRAPDDEPAPQPLASTALVSRGPQAMSRRNTNDALAFSFLSFFMLSIMFIPLAGMTAGIVLGGSITAVGAGIIAWMRSVYAQQARSQEQSDDQRQTPT